MAAAMLLAARSGVNPPVSKEVSIGPFDVLLVYSTPTPTLVVAALLTTLAMVVLVVGLDAWGAKRVTHPARRPRDAIMRPLRAEATITRLPGRVVVTAVVPARNEELHIAATLESLRRQTVPPTAVWVIADNCTDNTAEVARAHGAEVYTTIDNRHRKAGGLNQLLSRLLPTLGPLAAVLVMDADTVMVDDFLERAASEFDESPDLDAVGGVFVGDDSAGLLAQLQRNEYLRYGRDISRRQGRVFVLTGTASLFRADALVAVAAARGSELPGVAGDVYDTFSLGPTAVRQNRGTSEDCGLVTCNVAAWLVDRLRHPPPFVSAPTGSDSANKGSGPSRSGFPTSDPRSSPPRPTNSH